MHAIFVTQLIDERDPALGFTCGWIRALAARADGVTVIANEVRTPEIGPAVRVLSLGKERGAGKVARGARFERAVEEATRRRPAMLLAHMCPEYLVYAAPITKARHVPALLWFAHPSITARLAVAERLADGIVTSLPGAYPRTNAKVRVIGQAIDTAALAYSPRAIDPVAPRFIAIGRTSPSKGFDRIIRALARARADGLSSTLHIVGPSTNGAERTHADALRALIADLDLGDAVTLAPGVPPAEVADVIREADVLINAMVAGSGDKVVFEAMALGRPVLVSNPAFAPMFRDLALDLAFDRGNEAELASRMVAVATADPQTLADLTDVLRDRVVEQHSMDRWARAVLDYAEDLR